MKTIEVTITYKYDEKDLPKGVSESDLKDALDETFTDFIEDTFAVTVYDDDNNETDITVEYVEHSIF
ncbi:MAG: hypothetical protein LBN27_12190 [Prevotellaceae bacterium]|jgi:hypothetical protein|nr:hypothetical protein [Prevotellaceae bacterium]